LEEHEAFAPVLALIIEDVGVQDGARAGAKRAGGVALLVNRFRK
jgi:hypothetical protein